MIETTSAPTHALNESIYRYPLVNGPHNTIKYAKLLSMNFN